MAVPRVDWTCPSCGKKFAVRADVPTPRLCPKCEASVAELPTETADMTFEAAPAPSFAATSPAPRSSARRPQPPQAIDVFEMEAADTAPPAAPARSMRKRFPALRAVAVLYKLGAVVVLVVGFVLLVNELVAIIQSQEALGRAMLAFRSFTSFGLFLLISISMLAMGELIELWIVVEENTRRSTELMASIELNTRRG